MFKEQKAYLIICLSISSVMIYLVNVYADVSITKLSGYFRMATGLFLLLVCVTLIIYAIKRNIKTYRVSLITLLIFFMLNLTLVTEVVAYEFHKYEYSKIDKMYTCEKATIQFNKDLKSEDLKFFMFGVGMDEDFIDSIEHKYNLQVYYMGCLVSPSLDCYNQLVSEHFKSIYNNEVLEIERINNK